MKFAFSSFVYNSASHSFICWYTGSCSGGSALYGRLAKIRSAVATSMPLFTACSLYTAPSARAISVSLRAACVLERCTIVTPAPCSHRPAQMSCAELFEPTTTARSPFQSSPLRKQLECTCVPLNSSMPG